MKLRAENHSMYPRVGESDEKLRLRRAHHKFDHDEITRDELDEIVDSYVTELLDEQVQADLDVVTDGMIRWYDHVSHLAGKLDGAEVAGLVRFFDTNYLVREAEVTGRVEWSEPMLVDEFKHAESVSERPVKVILTGPFTLARHSILEDSPYDSARELAGDYAAALRREVQALREAGVQHLQVEEPSLLKHPGESTWVLEAVDGVLAAAGEVQTRLATYFGDAAELYGELQDTGADMLVLDFTYSDQLEEVIRSSGSDKQLGLGLLNGRNTRLEDVSETASRVERLLEAAGEGPHSLTFSCSLDYLPRDRAERKLQQLRRIRDAVLEGAVQV